MKEILITSFENPDIDGLACMVAYSELLNKTGRPVVYKIFGQPHTEAKFVLDHLKFKPQSTKKDIKNFDQIILVDSALIHGISKSLNHDKVIRIIDHRKVNDADFFKNANVQIEFVGSCATLIAEKFKEKNIKPTKVSAALLYCAIVSNTLNFKAKVTTDRDKTMAKWIAVHAKLPHDFVHQMFSAKSNFNGNKLHLAIANDYVFNKLGTAGVGIAQIEMVDASSLIKTRLKEIINELKMLEKKYHTDINFLSIIDLENGYNTFIATDSPSKDLLEKVLNIHFEGDIARRESLIMRKEIAPLLKEELEK